MAAARVVERVAVAKVVEETEVARAEETGVVRVEGATGEAREGAAKAEEKAAACNACHSRCRALADKKNAETYKRLTQAGEEEIQNATMGSSAEFVAYKSMREVPTPKNKELVLAVDQERETVLVPIYGQLVPFHVMSVKSASVSQDAGAAFIRINFQHPTGSGAVAVQKYAARRDFRTPSF